MLQESDLLEECFDNNVTAILLPGQSRVKVKFDCNAIALPEGVYEMTSGVSLKTCVYYVTVTSKY